MKKNLHYGKLPEATAAKLSAQMPGTLIAGRFRVLEATDLSLKHMRDFAKEALVAKVSHCFVCANTEVHCPENKRVECLCGRTYFKYYDVTDYTSFTEQSRWNLFWNRLNFKMSSILKKHRSS